MRVSQCCVKLLLIIVPQYPPSGGQSKFVKHFTFSLFIFPYSRVQLNRRFGSSSDFNLLDKLLESLRARVTSNSSGNREAFVNRIKDGIAENIKPQPAIQQCETIVESFQQD